MNWLKIKKHWESKILPHLQRIREWIVKFSQKYSLTLASIFIPIISLLLAYLSLELLIKISSFKFFWFLLNYTFLLILVYIYFVYITSGEWINRHQAFLAVLGILIPIILFWWQQAANESKLFMSREVSLNEENNRNINHLQDIIASLKNDPKTIFWRDFSTDKYKQYWDYIHLNYSQECKNLYANITIQLDVLNNINKMRRELLLIPNDFYKDMLKFASNTEPIFDDIVRKCQKF